MTTIYDLLKKPFNREKIHWRPAQVKDGKGLALAYIDARDVMERLDEVVGPDNWQCRYPFPGCCEIGIRVKRAVGHTGDEIIYDEDWIWKANGAGETKVESEKGQYSDAFKRAAVLWGIGQYLYDLPSQWFPMKGKYEFDGTPKLPNWALPGATIDKEIVTTFVRQVTDALAAGDDDALRELWAEWTDPDEKAYLWSRFNSQQRSMMKEIGA